MENDHPITSANRMTFTGRRFQDGQWMAVWVEDGKIVGDEPIQRVALDHSAQRWIVPGFVDLQVNGFAGRSFLEPDVTVENVEYVAQALLRTGTTRFLPTIVTADLDDMCRQLAVITSAIDTHPLVSKMCPGVHLEGPFINPDDGPRGAHPRHHVRKPSIEDFDRLYDAAAGRICMMTLAPEQPGATDLIRHAVNRGVIAALGHHRANRKAIAAAVEAGARMSTHLGNGTDATMDRHDNHIWHQLAEDRLWASFIADGHHLPPAVLQCMLRSKTPLRSVLITDAAAPAGMPPGRYRFGGIETELEPGGRIVLPGTPFLAGSAADMPTVVGRAVIDGGASFIEAVGMAAIRPRMLLPDWPGRWGCFAGDPADLVELDWYPDDGRIAIRQVTVGPFAVRTTTIGADTTVYKTRKVKTS